MLNTVSVDTSDLFQWLKTATSWGWAGGLFIPSPPSWRWILLVNTLFFVHWRGAALQPPVICLLGGCSVAPPNYLFSRAILHCKPPNIFCWGVPCCNIPIICSTGGCSVPNSPLFIQGTDAPWQTRRYCSLGGCSVANLPLFVRGEMLSSKLPLICSREGCSVANPPLSVRWRDARGAGDRDKCQLILQSSELLGCFFLQPSDGAEDAALRLVAARETQPVLREGLPRIRKGWKRDGADGMDEVTSIPCLIRWPPWG